MTRTKCRRGLLLAVLLTTVPAMPAIALELASWNSRERALFNLVNQQRARNGLQALVGDARLHNASRAHSEDMLARDFFAHVNPDGTGAAGRIRAAGYSRQSTGENIDTGSGRALTGEGVVERVPVAAAREVMFGTANLASIQSFAVASGLGEEAGYSWQDVGVGWSQADWDDWDQVLTFGGGWMGSAAHRGNILDREFTDLGVGYAFSADDSGTVNDETYWTQNFASGDSRPGSVTDPALILAPIVPLLLD